MTDPDKAAMAKPLKTPNAKNSVEVSAADLPLHCPTDDCSLWDSHPRVYIPVEENGGQAKCLYCGTVYILKDPKKD